MTDYRDTVGKKKNRQTGFSIGGAIDSAQDAVSDAADTVGDTVDDATSGFDDTVDDVSSGVDDAVGNVGDTVDDTFDDAQDTFDDTVDDVSSGIDDTVDDVSSGFDDTVDDVSDTVDDTVDDAFDSVEDAQDSLDYVIGGAEDSFDDISGGIGDTVDDAVDTGQDIIGGAGDTFDDTVEDIGNLIPDVEAPDVGSVIDNASGEVNDAFDDVTDIGGDVAEGAGDFFGDVSEGAGDVAEGAGDFFGDATDTADDIFDDTVDETTDFAGDVGDALGSSADNIGDSFDSFFGGAADLAGDIGEGATNIAGDAASLGLDVVDSVADTVLFTPFNIGQEFGQQAAQALGNIGGGGIVENEGDTTTTQGQNPDGTPVEWGELKKVTTVTGAVIFKQESLNTPDKRVRHFAIGQDKSGDKVAYGSNNKAVKINSVESLGELPHFDTVQAAKEVVPHRGGRNNERNESETQWQKPQKVNQVGSVSILKQTGQDSSGEQKTRFMAATQTDTGTKVFLSSATSVVSVNDIDTLDDAPTFDTREEAESVATQYMRTLQGGAGGGMGGGSGSGSGSGSGEGESGVEWGEAEQVGQVESVIILEQTGQAANGEERTRYLAATQNESGETLLIKSGSEAVRINNLQSSSGIPSFQSQSEAESVAQEYIDTPEEEKDVSDQPTSGTGTSGGSGFLGGLSPITLGAGALAIGGGLYTLYGGDGKKKKKSGSNGGTSGNGGDMSNLSVRANTNRDSQGQ